MSGRSRLGDPGGSRKGMKRRPPPFPPPAPPCEGRRDTRQSIVKLATGIVGGGGRCTSSSPSENYPIPRPPPSPLPLVWPDARGCCCILEFPLRSAHPPTHLQTAAYRSPINSARWLIPRHYSPVDDDVIDAAIKVPTISHMYIQYNTLKII